MVEPCGRHLHPYVDVVRAADADPDLGALSSIAALPRSGTTSASCVASSCGSSSSGASPSSGSASGNGSSPCDGALAARNVATSMISRPKNTCASRNRPPDQPAVAEQSFDLLRQSVRGDVEVLRLEPNQQVAHTTADQEGHAKPASRSLYKTRNAFGEICDPRSQKFLRSRDDERGTGCGRHRGRGRGVQ